MKRIALALIDLYQAAFSPFFGHSCRFAPTCSEYAKLAIVRYGVWRGSKMAVCRILRCHPFHPGGIDEP